MGRFFVKALLLALPFLLLAGYVEFRLSKINTNYLNKRLALEKAKDETQVIVLGSSLSYFGMNPQYFSVPGFNAAYRAQSYYFDYQILKKYVPQMPKLKIALITIIFYTMGTDLNNEGSIWRAYFYHQYMHLPLEFTGNYHTLLDAKRFSKIALFGERTQELFWKNFDEKIDDDSDANGWFNGGSAPPPGFDYKNTKDGARAHNVIVSPKLFVENGRWITEMIKLLKEHGVTPIIVQTPVHGTYRDLLDPKLYGEMMDVVNGIAKAENVPFYDYASDPRFGLEDYIELADHLNGDGAKKFSQILDQEVIQPNLKK